MLTLVYSNSSTSKGLSTDAEISVDSHEPKNTHGMDIINS